jgi:hypothetical protein
LYRAYIRDTLTLHWICIRGLFVQGLALAYNRGTGGMR